MCRTFFHEKLPIQIIFFHSKNFRSGTVIEKSGKREEPFNYADFSGFHFFCFVSFSREIKVWLDHEAQVTHHAGTFLNCLNLSVTDHHHHSRSFPPKCSPTSFRRYHPTFPKFNPVELWNGCQTELGKVVVWRQQQPYRFSSNNVLASSIKELRLFWALIIFST